MAFFSLSLLSRAHSFQVCTIVSVMSVVLLSVLSSWCCGYVGVGVGVGGGGGGGVGGGVSGFVVSGGVVLVHDVGDVDVGGVVS